MMRRLAVLPIARSTFDLQLAQATVDRAVTRLEQLDYRVLGNSSVSVDISEVETAAARINHEEIDALVVLQATFADSTLISAVAEKVRVPLVMWAFPEERTGGRLRLNSLCGINLAAYALRRSGRSPGYLYADPGDPELQARLAAALGAPDSVEPPSPSSPALRLDREGDAAEVLAGLRHARVGIVGERPDGFEPCDYDAARVLDLFGIVIDRVPLEQLFVEARHARDESVEASRSRTRAMVGLDELDPVAVERSMRLHLGLRQLAAERGWAGVATRCWPECFTQFGGAVCAPHAMLTNDGTPGCCEADAYGVVTSLILRDLAGSPPFVADLVHLDFSDDTGVFWHCGNAPADLADPDLPIRAGVHSNRRLPLLNEFALKPGRITICRLSQAGERHALVVGSGRVLARPASFSGTSGVVQFDTSARAVLDTIMTRGLEHHYALVYGDVTADLVALAAAVEIPLIDLGSRRTRP